MAQNFCILPLAQIIGYPIFPFLCFENKLSEFFNRDLESRLKGNAGFEAIGIGIGVEK
jgi:hypothetical protein